MMRSPTTLGVLTLATLALASGPDAAASFISDFGTGDAPYSYDFSGTFQHLKGNGQDFEIGLGTAPSGYAVTGQSSWNQGDNTFSIAFDAITSQVSLTLNGVTAFWTAPAAPTHVTLQLVAQNKNSKHAELALSNPSVDGAPMSTTRAAGAMKASDMPGTDAPSQFTWLRFSDLPSGSWTLSGNLGADWTGPAPERGYTRMDVGFEVPSQGSLAILALAGAGALVRRRGLRVF